MGAERQYDHPLPLYIRRIERCTGDMKASKVLARKYHGYHLAINVFRPKMSSRLLAISLWSHSLTWRDGAKNHTTSDTKLMKGIICCALPSAAGAWVWWLSWCVHLLHPTCEEEGWSRCPSLTKRAMSLLEVKSMQSPGETQVIPAEKYKQTISPTLRLSRMFYAISSLHGIVQIGWHLRTWVWVFLKSPCSKQDSIHG